MTHHPRWISDKDSFVYFKLTGIQLFNNRVHLITEREYRQNVEFPEIGNYVYGSKQWMYQVFKCAERLQGTVNADAALSDFLSKNRRREAEICGRLGLTAGRGRA